MVLNMDNLRRLLIVRWQLQQIQLASLHFLFQRFAIAAWYVLEEEWKAIHPTVTREMNSGVKYTVPKCILHQKV
jgi:hypothetical protein